jgi:hypothetical protein
MFSGGVAVKNHFLKTEMEKKKKVLMQCPSLLEE